DAPGRPPPGENAPGGIGIRGHAGRVQEDGYRIAVETILHKQVVVGRNEEVVPGGDSAHAKLDPGAQQPLRVGHVDDAERFASVDLLHREDVADLVVREARAEAV